MRSYTRIFLTLLLLSAPILSLFGQEFGMGAILDSAEFERVQAKPLLLSRSYLSVPRSASLKRYGPVPESQGQYGTCTGWATAFTARTISESVALDRTDRTQSSTGAFSPVFAYMGYYQGRVIDWSKGASIPSVLDMMKSDGAVKRQPFELNRPPENIQASDFAALRRYPILDYVRLFSNPRGTPGTVAERVPPVKMSLSNGKPVIIGMNTPASFHNARDVWRPKESPHIEHGGHAMVVVGYDDDMYGGAFEIQNSWGTGWGNGGYIWITYGDFAGFVNEAYEMIENLALYRDAARFSASIEIEVLRGGAGMPVVFDDAGFYRTVSSHSSGTEFRFVMTNREPAYVYAFGADSGTSNVSRVFPGPGVSPILDYGESAVAWPGENLRIRLDDTVGTDYLVVLYSKESLDIQAIERRFASAAGTFPERVARAVGNDLIPGSQARHERNRVEFSATSTSTSAVFALLLAIDHTAR